MPKPYTDAQRAAFVLAYLKTSNISAAAREIGADRWAGQRLMADPDIQDAITKAQLERFEKLKVEGHDVLAALVGAAYADPNELTEFRRGCCRHCWGADFKFQYTTQRKLLREQREYEKTPDALVYEFEHGGIGFDPRRPANHECPECFGEGVGEAIIKDTRYLSPGARSLYAGVKITKDGIELKTNSQDKARELLARHLSLLNDKIKVEGAEDLVARLTAGRKRTRG